jgi:hypothetical protein
VRRLSAEAGEKQKEERGGVWAPLGGEGGGGQWAVHTVEGPGGQQRPGAVEAAAVPGGLGAQWGGLGAPRLGPPRTMQGGGQPVLNRIQKFKRFISIQNLSKF